MLSGSFDCIPPIKVSHPVTVYPPFTSNRLAKVEPKRPPIPVIKTFFYHVNFSL